MRKSRQRDAILSVVKSTDCHPTADWVYHEARRRIPGLSLGTVYRNLKVLCELGWVRCYEGPGGVSRFDGAVATHHHFRCDRCGEMQDVDAPVDASLDRQVADRTGLDVRYHVLEFRGLCEGCRLERRRSSGSEVEDQH